MSSGDDLVAYSLPDLLDLQSDSEIGQSHGGFMALFVKPLCLNPPGRGSEMSLYLVFSAHHCKHFLLLLFHNYYIASIFFRHFYNYIVILIYFSLIFIMLVDLSIHF